MKEFAAPIRRKARRKRHPDSENEVPVSQHTIQATRDDSTTAEILRMQGAMGNRAVQRMLGGQKTGQNPGGNTVQRLMTYKSYKKDTAAMGRRNHIRPIDIAFKAYTQEQGGLNPQEKLARLKLLIGLCDTYLADPKRQKSKRRDGVDDLKTELVDEVGRIQVDLTGNDFSEGNVTEKQRDAVGGGMNKLDYVKYNFGITQETDDQGVTTDKKLVGGQFEAYFKEQTAQQNLAGTRGQWTGIDQSDPKFAERSVATYEIAKLLDPSIVPPTFMAKHDRDGKVVDGFVMQKVEGVGGDKPGARQYKDDPVYRQAMSKLLLLDFICGQVDRHQGNYIIQVGSDGKVKGVKAIDNDLSFGKDFKDLTYGGGGGAFGGMMFKQFVSAGGKIQDMNEIDKPFAQKIIALSENTQKLQLILGALLKTSEVDATVTRLQSLADFLRPMVNDSSPILKSKWE